MAEGSASSIVQIFSALGKISDAPRSFACLDLSGSSQSVGSPSPRHFASVLHILRLRPDGVVSSFSRGNQGKHQASAGSIPTAIENDCTVSCHKAVDGIRK
jgi:hypothetical protein